jgi:hypothetical protein
VVREGSPSSEEDMALVCVGLILLLLWLWWVVGRKWLGGREGRPTAGRGFSGLASFVIAKIPVIMNIVNYRILLTPL